MMYLAALIFVIGLVENFVSTWQLKVISKDYHITAGLLDILNVLIWYFILRLMVENINNVNLAVMYAIGSGLGTYLSARYFEDWLTIRLRKKKKTVSVSKKTVTIPPETTISSSPKLETITKGKSPDAPLVQ